MYGLLGLCTPLFIFFFFSRRMLVSIVKSHWKLSPQGLATKRLRVSDIIILFHQME